VTTFAEWLALREPADAAARSRELVDLLPPTDGWLIHDLGCGTGAMGRWLAPLLPGPQQWVLHDRDAALLAVADVPGATVEKRQSDIARLPAGDLAGATLITASALLDMLTEDELAAMVCACVHAGCPVLLSMSVTGRVELTPDDPSDGRAGAAFNAHQRRGGRLGPDAIAVAVALFGRAGYEVIARPSPWRLDAAHADLVAAWFTGWIRAARELDAALAAETDHYERRRLDAVTVGHTDLLALPVQSVSNRGESA
jgi:hypothetical protein